MRYRRQSQTPVNNLMSYYPHTGTRTEVQRSQASPSVQCDGECTTGRRRSSVVFSHQAVSVCVTLRQGLLSIPELCTVCGRITRQVRRARERCSSRPFALRASSGPRRAQVIAGKLITPRQFSLLSPVGTNL